MIADLMRAETDTFLCCCVHVVEHHAPGRWQVQKVSFWRYILLVNRQLLNKVFLAVQWLFTCVARGVYLLLEFGILHKQLVSFCFLGEFTGIHHAYWS